MRRATWIAVLLCLAFGVSTGGDSLLSCRTILLSDISWVASFDDDHPVTPENHASIVHNTDEYSEYYGMAWNSPEITDLSLTTLDRLDRTGVTAIKLTLAASEPVQVVVVVQVEGAYCNGTWRYASADAIQVGTETQEYELHVSEFIGDPFQGCVGELPEDALERLGAIILLPESQAGELRVYDVDLCGEGIEPIAAGEPEEELPIDEPDTATPVYTVDSDVTLDSVVQIGDGPQELSTDIKFYPNTRRARSGDVIHWTLEVGGDSGLVPPLQVLPELDNDLYRESAILDVGVRHTFTHEYSAADAYRPYLLVEDSKGTKGKIISNNLLGVYPEGASDTRLGLRIPSVEDPIGDVIKAGGLNIVDERLFETPAGLNTIRESVQQWADIGFNLVLINFLWVLDAMDDIVFCPLYEEHVPEFGKATNRLEQMLVLTEILHEYGIRVCWALTLQWIGETLGLSRFDFNPGNDAVFFDAHREVNLFYAEVAEAMGVELLLLDFENLAFSLNPRSVAVFEAVDAVYSGIITDGALQDMSIASRSPLTPYLDLIFLSAGPDSFEGAFSVEEMENAFVHQYFSKLVKPLQEFDKPGMIEFFAPYDFTGTRNSQYSGYQERAYEAVLQTLADYPTNLQGFLFWELTINPEWRQENWQYNPIGRPAEDVLSHYFNNVLPDQRLFTLRETTSMPNPLRSITDFESAGLEDVTIAAYRGTAEGTIVGRSSFSGQSCLEVSFDSSRPEGEFAIFSYFQNYTVDFWFPRAQDWSSYSSLCFWLRNQSNPSTLWVSVFDEDGDRFVAEVDINYRTPQEWMGFAVDLQKLFHPGAVETGDKLLNLHAITRIQIMEKIWHGRDQKSWIDHVYLGGPLGW